MSKQLSSFQPQISYPVNSFYDDFNDASIDTGKWTVTGNVSESGGFLTLTGNNSTAKFTSNTTFTTSNTIVFRGNLPRTTASTHSVGLMSTSGLYYRSFSNSWNINANIYIQELNNGTQVTLYDTGIACGSTQMEFRIELLSDYTAKYYIDNVLVYTSSQVINYQTWNISGFIYDNGSQMKIDSVNYYTTTTKLYMPLNGNSVDISGNGNHGTDSLIDYIAGKFGRGARFSASSLITLPNLNFGTSNFVISFWLYPTQWNNNRRIWASSTNSSSPFNNFEINYNTTNGFNVNHYNGSTDLTVKNGANKPSLNNWHHVVVTRNGDNLYFYIDNILFASGSGWSSRSCSGDYQQILGLGGSNSLESILDELIVENRAWTPQEISTYYKKSILNYRTKQVSIFSNFISYILIATQQTYTLTGIATLFNFALRMLATVQTYTLTGINALFGFGKGIVADVSNYIFTGNDTNFTKALQMIATVSTYTLTGISTILIYIKQVVGELGQFILTGNPVNFRFKGWTKTPKDIGGTWTKTPKN